MRTTLNIDDDALAYAKDRARATGKSLGQVVSEALLETSRPRAGSIEVSEDGFPYLPRPSGAKTVSSDQIIAALEEEDRERHASS